MSDAKFEMSLDELLALPVSVPLATAGRALGIGRSTAYDLAKRGVFPCPVLAVGARFKVARSALFEVLGVSPEDATPVARAS